MDQNKEDNDFCKHVYAVQTLLMEAVDKRVRNTERPVAYFLSGGLDSSIIAAIGASISTKEPITTYSVGIRGSESPDLIHARLMAKHIGSNHHEISFSPEEAVAYLRRVICKLESYDCTTIRASVPMFLLSDYIAHHSEHRVLLSGEGADELFGGYLYFHHAPSLEAFQDETVRLLKNIHQFDGLRADRCTAGHGLELRVPFLDLALVNYVIAHVPPAHKSPSENHGVEKRLLREAFAHMLPREIVERQKNGMSDAVGYSWVDHLRAVAAPRYTHTYVLNPPLTDEERWYREIYHEFYKDEDCAHAGIWRPLWVTETDPSARKLNVFSD
jgi:asparagine synthase (glutamine-hydrolysing)